MPYKYPSIPVPYQTLTSIQECCVALKEAIEMMTGQLDNSGELEAANRRVLQLESNFGSKIRATLLRIDEVIANNDLALAEATLILQANIDDTNARVDAVDLARVNGDGALALDITNVNIKYNNISASGSVKLLASGGIWGYEATFSVYLTASSFWGGMTLGVNSSGATSVIFNTGTFKFQDSGTALPIFYYSLGEFFFYGNVRMHGSLVVDGTVTTAKVVDKSIKTAKIDDNAVSNWGDGTAAGGAQLNVLVWARAGDRIVFTVTVLPNDDASTYAALNITCNLDGAQAQVTPVHRSLRQVNTVPDPMEYFYQVNTTSFQVTWTVPGTPSETLVLRTCRVLASSFCQFRGVAVAYSR